MLFLLLLSVITDVLEKKAQKRPLENKKGVQQTRVPESKRFKKGDVVDGWQFVGGDPGNKMNWRKK